MEPTHILNYLLRCDQRKVARYLPHLETLMSMEKFVSKDRKPRYSLCLFHVGKYFIIVFDKLFVDFYWLGICVVLDIVAERKAIALVEF